MTLIRKYDGVGMVYILNYTGDMVSPQAKA